MDRPSTSLSGERSPLVRQSKYAFKTNMSRGFQKKFQTFQCCICVGLLAVLGAALLITVSYSLSEGIITAVTNTTDNVNLSLSASTLTPILELSWPRPDSPAGRWVGDDPLSNNTITAAITSGNDALESRKIIEVAALNRGHIIKPDTPAGRAQRATATSVIVGPLADAGYAAGHATKVLTERIPVINKLGGVGIGPRIVNTKWHSPDYCLKNTSTVCEPSKYRSYNGSCNNRQHPRRWGVSFTPFRRSLPPDYEDGISVPRGGWGGKLPSAREVSLNVHRPSYPKDSTFTVMLAVWGQFLDHDMTATALSKGANGTSISCCSTSSMGLRSHPECFPVHLTPSDAYYNQYNISCMEFVRSAPAPTCNFGPREQLNQATAFIDGSVIYGVDNATVSRLRSFKGGRLRMLSIRGRELLPPSLDPGDSCNTQEMNNLGKYCFDSGDARANENLHLTTMHLLWARQHNNIAAHLQKINPMWNDETLFQESRHIIAAQLQHVTYNEFLPNVLGIDLLQALNISIKSSNHSDVYNEAVDPSIANNFAASSFRFAHTLLPSLIHATDMNKGSASYVHLHEMLFNPYPLYGEMGINFAVMSALHTNIDKVNPHVTDELSNHLFESSNSPHGACGLDLVSLNIQRGRDHGLPPYVYWREHCGLTVPKTFSDMKGDIDSATLERLANVYNTVESVDAYTGALSESPKGRLIGPTLSCLIADQFLRLKVGDRYWYETSEVPQAFTEEQLKEIKKTTLASIICSNADSLPKAQRRVMELTSKTNPLVPCSDIQAGPALIDQGTKGFVDFTDAYTSYVIALLTYAPLVNSICPESVKPVADQTIP